MELAIQLLLVVVGIIHITPVVGVVGSGQLSKLYGIPFEEPNLLILMRNRALLFGLLGALILVSVVDPALRPLALIGAYGNLISFLWVSKATRNYNPKIKKVVKIDIIAGVCLIAATVLIYWPG